MVSFSYTSPLNKVKGSQDAWAIKFDENVFLVSLGVICGESAKMSNIPRLSQRPANQDKFCTSSIFEAGIGCSRIVWKQRPHLVRNFDLYQKKEQELSQLCRLADKEQGIALFWLKIATGRCEPQIWEPVNRNQLAMEHLAAYFQTNCYYAAKEIFSQSPEHSWDDYFGIAMVFVYDFNKLFSLLKSYKNSQGTLANYVQKALINTIKSEAKVRRFSRWRLLCTKGEENLKDALAKANFDSAEIACFLFARKYFRQVYLIKVKNPNRPKGQQWPEPDSQDFEAAAQCYNAEKMLPIAPHEVSAGLNVRGKNIESWMKSCIEALQNYRKIPLSLDYLEEAGITIPANEEEEETPTPSEQKKPTFPQLSKETQAAFWQKLQTLKPEQHKLLLLNYGIGLTQQEMEKFLGVKQSSISRRRDTIHKNFLQTLTKISGADQWVKQYIDGWLINKYRSPEHFDLIQAGLVEAIKKLEAESQQILQVCYGQKIAVEQIAKLQGIPLEEVQAKLKQAKHNLEKQLICTLNDWIKNYVDVWLGMVYKDLVKKSCQKLKFSWKSEIATNKIEVILQETLNLIREHK
ncbi:sigma-70 family RNA polymerase sigma factor [Ancylothrix sp. C2]|uniref:sigma-70 family RNA polymerase sigma factor n=1 Tax=Ancylothrix sp. D3o TaxID=2953691 RepID=UPI0021BB2FCB|nr:sigma-70 family RNA polymerase sigma factor [Ancylothrix sp. D3o]MCT7952010.1 sigma-70 family RNA polymerase sigma factor [Ancylothrix sp. D3o]